MDPTAGTFLPLVYPLCVDLVEAEKDEQLVRQAREGRGAAFEALMRQHNARLYRVVRSVLKNEPEIEEVMQEAYVHALEHLEDLHSGALFGPWLRRIAFHEALARAQRTRNSPFDEVDMETLEPVSPQLSPEAEKGRAQLKEALEEAVDSLPDPFRLVFMLREVDGYSVAETAELLGVHQETVKTRLHRARARLQSMLSEWADHELPRTFGFHASRCDRVVGAVLARLGSKKIV